MKYALVKGDRQEATPKGRGVCQCCGGETIAKCGKFKQHHWAHKSLKECDLWWENETEWHRLWKNEFPKDWQEIVHIDKVTREKHIADVKTAHGMVVEFQHSLLALDEVSAREKFYGNMIWIVDGLRNLQDGICFDIGIRDRINDSTWEFMWVGRGKIFQRWANTTKPVFLDFRSKDTENYPILWHLTYFDGIEKVGALSPYRRKYLIESLCKGITLDLPSFDVRQQDELRTKLKPPKKKKPTDPQLPLFGDEYRHR